MQIALLAVIGLVVFQDARAANCKKCQTITTIMVDGEDTASMEGAIGSLAYVSTLEGNWAMCPVDATACDAGEFCLSYSTLVKWTDAAGDNTVTQVLDVMGCQGDLLDDLLEIQQTLTEFDSNTDTAADFSTPTAGANTCTAIKEAMCTGLDITLAIGGTQVAETGCTIECEDSSTFTVESRVVAMEFIITYTTFTAESMRAKRDAGDPTTGVDVASYTDDMNTACEDIEGFLMSSLVVTDGDAMEPPSFYMFTYQLYFTTAVTVDADDVADAVDAFIAGDDSQGAALYEEKDGAARNSVAVFALLASALIAAL
jgi:hypothetical protein